MRQVTVIACTFVLVGLALSAAAMGQTQPEYHFVPERGTTYEVVTAERKLLEVSLLNWGPDWNWFSFPNEPRATDDGGRLIDVRQTIGGTEASVRLVHRATAEGNTVVLEYEVTAEEASPLTLIALGLAAEEDAFARVEVERANGTRERVGLPLGRGDVTGEVEAMTFLDDEEQTPFRIAFDEPREVTTDGGARIHIAADAIEADTPMTLTARITAPEPIRFYPLAENASQQSDTDDWFAYPVGEAGTPIDLSFLNRDEEGEYVPAGAHGFVQVDGDRFVFEDGTEARFWGVNLSAGAALGPESRAEQLAERLARLGVNIVRLHHLDSWYQPIIDYDHPSGTTQHLDEASMRRLDRTIYEMKQRGIYVILDPWVQRTFTEADDVPAADELGSGNFHLHPYIFFNDRMRELHKKTMRQVWNHVNEFTGVAYTDEPALAMTGIANETLMQRGSNHVQLEPYRTEFLRRYREWAERNDADPDRGERVIAENWPRDHQRFYIHVMHDFYGDMHQFFREEIGLKIPINASNWYRWHWEIVAQQEQDFTDAHLYYGGDQVGAGDGIGGLWVSHPPHEPITPFGRIGGTHLHGKPVITSEVGQNPPKTYRSAYYPGLAAVAALQGWDAITPYAYSQSPGGPDTHLSGQFQGAYAFEADPATIASLAMGALIYRRGDVERAEKITLVHADEDHIFQFHHGDEQTDAYEHSGEFNRLLETHQVTVHLGDTLPDDVTDAVDRVMTPEQLVEAYDPEQTEIRSENGQLWRDWERGVGTIDTPRTQAAYGRLGEEEALTTADVRFAIETPFATVSLSSLSDEPIRRSERLLLTAVARAENTGMSYDLIGSRVLELGGPPMIAEPVVGQVAVSSDRTALRMHPVRVDGSRGRAVDVPVRNGVATLPLRADHETIFYEVEAVDSPADAGAVDLPHRLRHLAALADQRDRPALARDLLNLALERRPDESVSRQLLALLERTAEAEDRRATLREHVRLYRGDAVAQLELIRLLTDDDKPEQQARALRRVVDRDEEGSLSAAVRSRVATDLAALQLERGERSAGLEALVKALQIDRANRAAAERMVEALRAAGASEDRLARARELRERASPAEPLGEEAFGVSLVHDELDPTEPARLRLALTNVTDRPLGVGPGQTLPRHATLTAAGREGVPPLTLAITRRLRIEPGETVEQMVNLHATGWAGLLEQTGCEPMTLEVVAEYETGEGQVLRSAADPLRVGTWADLSRELRETFAGDLARRLGRRACESGDLMAALDEPGVLSDDALAWALSFLRPGDVEVGVLRERLAERADERPVSLVLRAFQGGGE